MADKKATLLVDGKKIELDMIAGTLGPDVIDVSGLFKEGYFTYDSGFNSTAACESRITYIDGDKGTLLHRGYPIEQLASHSTFLEVCYLLLMGNLPSRSQYEDFCKDITHHTMVHEQIRNFFNGFRRDAHPMAVMVGVVGALSAFYHDTLDIKNPEHRAISALRLIAKMPTIAAMCYKYSIGQPFMAPLNKLSYAENFLQMMFGTPCEEFKPDPVLARALDRIFILHADHEQNASTSTVRMAGSTGANPFACISAAIGALWGPALGHRVYKNYDPRATVMRETCHEVLEAVGAHNDPVFKLAMELEKIALKDPYFIEKKLYPNVDFYSGITLRAIGIPTNMFTVIFALARTVGWVAQWNEMISGTYRLGRPRQLYTGEKARDYVEREKRK